MLIKYLSIIVAGFVVSGCALKEMKNYSPLANEKTAKIDISEFDSTIRICVNNERLFVTSNSDGYAIIPANQRVSLEDFYYVGDSSYSTSCSFKISFIPKTDEKYFLNQEFRNQKCFMEVYKRGASNRIGLDVIDSMEPSKCPPYKF